MDLVTALIGIFPFYLLMGLLGWFDTRLMLDLTQPLHQGRCADSLENLKISAETTACEGFRVSYGKPFSITKCACKDNPPVDVFEVMPGLYGLDPSLFVDVKNRGELQPDKSYYFRTSLAYDESYFALGYQSTFSLFLFAVADSPSTFGSCTAGIGRNDCICELCADKVTFKVDCSSHVLPGDLYAGAAGPNIDTCFNAAFRSP